MSSRKNPNRHKKCFDSFPMKKHRPHERKKLQIASRRSPEMAENRPTHGVAKVKFNECYCNTFERNTLIYQRNVVQESTSGSWQEDKQTTNTNPNDGITEYTSCSQPKFDFNDSVDFVQGYDTVDSDFSHFYTPLPLFCNYKRWLSDIVEYRRRNWKECHANA